MWDELGKAIDLAREFGAKQKQKWIRLSEVLGLDADNADEEDQQAISLLSQKAKDSYERTREDIRQARNLLILLP